LLAALLFAIHPLRVESVAWATERKDVLSLFFGLPAALFFLRHVRAIKNRTWSISGWYILSLAFFSLSLLSKSLVITLPVVLLVLDWFPLKRMKSSGIAALLLEKIPYFVLSGAVATITMKAQVNAIVSFEQINMFTRILNAFKSIAVYMQLTLWPFGISPFYVHPNTISSVSLEYAMAILFFVVVTLFCFLMLKRQPVFMAVWLIYLITLLPFLGFTQVGAQAMAGRFTYLAGLPLALLFSIGVVTAYGRLAGSRPAAVTICIGVALLLGLYGFLTVREISFWKDDVTLWTRAIDLNPHSSGRAYFQRSNAYRMKRDYQRSLLDINEAFAIAVQKKYNAMHDLYSTRAGILSDMGNFYGAITDYTKALETATGETRSRVLYERGLSYQKTGRTDQASKDFKSSKILE
jgi:tetratricopeptide (TPR) repeat protein